MFCELIQIIAQELIQGRREDGVVPGFLLEALNCMSRK
jgi:hypothetical protein